MVEPTIHRSLPVCIRDVPRHGLSEGGNRIQVTVIHSVRPEVDAWAHSGRRSSLYDALNQRDGHGRRDDQAVDSSQG